MRRTVVTAAVSACVFAICGVACDAPDAGPVVHVTGALHSESKLQPMQPTACWVKDPDSTTSDADFDAKAAQFQATMYEWEEESGLRYQWKRRCSAPTQTTAADGTVVDVYPEDIRILWNELGRKSDYTIPGRGCTQNNQGGNWGSFPGQKGQYAHCRHNVSFAKGVSRNNILHESGHNLGWIHEQARTDNDSICQGTDPKSNQILLTEYDLESVMHYTYSECGNPGNLGSTGLSYLDRLGVAIAYPPVDGKVAIAHNGLAYHGFYAVRADTTIQPSWYARGAMPAVFKSIEWSQDFIGVPRTTISNEIAFPVTDAVPDGTGTFLHLTFVDPWKRQKFADEAIIVSTSIHTALLSTIL